MVVDLQAEGERPLGHRPADPAHADDPELLAAQAPAQHPGGGPAVEAAGAHHPVALGEAPLGGEDQGQGDVGGILGQHAGGVGDGKARGHGGGDVDVVDPRPEVGDQLQVGARPRDQLRVDPVGDGRGEHVRPRHGVGERLRAHRNVVWVQLDVEQLAHPGLDRVGQLARDHDFRLAMGHVRA